MGGRGGGGCLCLRWGGLGPGSQCGHCRSSVPARGPSRQHSHSDISQRDHCLRLSLIAASQKYPLQGMMHDLRDRKKAIINGWALVTVYNQLDKFD